MSVYLVRLPDLTASTPAISNCILAAGDLWRTVWFRLVTADGGRGKKMLMMQSKERWKNGQTNLSKRKQVTYCRLASLLQFSCDPHLR
jgi:hypothetical protein